MAVEPFYINTCTKCNAVYMNTHRDNACCRCGEYSLCETAVERDRRLGISKHNIRSFDIKDQLKGTKWERKVSEA